MKGYVYILRDSSGRFYIGSTIDLHRRLCQHQKGHTQTTRMMMEPILVFSQEYSTITIARIIEKRLKKLKRKDYIEKIILDGIIKMD